MFQAQHVGVYGIVVQEGNLLMIKKGRGPYTGLLDLPGGSFEHGESAEMTLHREFLEEVGAAITKMDLLCVENYTAIWTNKGEETSTHHIGLYYLVQLDTKSTIKTEADGHDSLGGLWVEYKTLHESAVAPIVAKVLHRLP